MMSLSFLFVGLYKDTKFANQFIRMAHPFCFLPYNDFSDLPCEVGFLESVEYLVEPKEVMTFTQFSLEFIDQEGIPSHSNIYEPRFGGHQTLEEREQSFFAKNQTLHCGFIKGPPGFSSTGFDIDVKDKAYMNECKIAVSSCIFGSSDFLRRPTSKKVNELSPY